MATDDQPSANKLKSLNDVMDGIFILPTVITCCDSIVGLLHRTRLSCSTVKITQQHQLQRIKSLDNEIPQPMKGKSKTTPVFVNWVSMFSSTDKSINMYHSEIVLKLASSSKQLGIYIDTVN